MILILSAMDVEIAALVDFMRDVEAVDLKGRTFYTGTLKGKKAAVGTSSVGKTNAACGAQMAIGRFSPDVLLHTGIAGSLSPLAPVGSVVLGEKMTYHDVNRDIMLNFFPHTEYFSSDERLLKLAERYLREQGGAYVRGLIATGDAFIETTAQKKAITDRMPALAVDMESAAIAMCAHVNGVPCAVVRAISDMADENSTETYEANKRSSSEIGAGLVMSMVEAL